MTYHLLNGDALLERFPKVLTGERLVCREAMIEGPFPDLRFPAFFQQRAEYFERQYPNLSIDYLKDVVPDLEQLRHLPKDAEVNLWFEHDLFCQTNLWFCLSLLQLNPSAPDAFLVSPLAHSPFAFSNLSQQELELAFEARQHIYGKELHIFKRLWQAYSKEEVGDLLQIMGLLFERFPFTRPAIEAHLDRMSSDGQYNRPMRTLRRLRRELGQEFGPVFKAFCEEEAIYGFGDMQVRKMWDSILE